MPIRDFSSSTRLEFRDSLSWNKGGWSETRELFGNKMFSFKEPCLAKGRVGYVTHSRAGYNPVRLVSVSFSEVRLVKIRLYMIRR